MLRFFFWRVYMNSCIALENVFFWVSLDTYYTLLYYNRWYWNTVIYHLPLYLSIRGVWGRRGRDRIVVGFTTSCAISACHY